MSAAPLETDGYYPVAPGKLAAIVTFLEMSEPLAGFTAPERPDLSMRRVENPDPAWFRDLYSRIGRDWLWFDRLAHSDAELTAIIDHPAVEVRALVQDGRDEGLLELNRRDPENVELAYFGLTPTLVGGGAGRWLMAQAQALAFNPESGPRPRRLWVHTCTLDSPRALPFYQQAGFRPFKRMVEIASDPRAAGVYPPEVAPHAPFIP